MNISSRALLVVALGLSLAPTQQASAARRVSTRAVACSSIVPLVKVSPTSRGGKFIYKSNWNTSKRREQNYGEGNHSQKGAAFLIQFRNTTKIPNLQRLNVLNMDREIIANMKREPRCSFVIANGRRVFYCGEHERWYLKTGTGQNVPQLAALATRTAGSSSLLIPLKDGTCVKILNPLDNREQK